VTSPGPNKRVIQKLDLPPGTPLSPDMKTWVEHIADDHKRCGGRFVSLISKRGGFTCGLDVLFLRRGAGGGDIDNRLKVLFDALKMPEVVSDLGGMEISDDEDPFFCLMEDDDLATRVSITSDRLLLPMEDGDKLNDIYIVLHVTISDESAVFTGNRLV
jgi:hypothetical protein